MSLPLDNRQINNVITTTADAKRARLIDNFFKGNALLTRLQGKNKVKWEGGDKIRVPFIYAGLGGGSYGKNDLFDTSQKEFMTELQFDWKRNYAPMALDGLDAAKNTGAARIINLTDALMKNARMTLNNNLGAQLFQATTGPNDFESLKSAIGNSGVYGGITRDTSAQGTAITSTINTVGGPLSFSMINTSFGDATIDNHSPDLIITTQTIFNKFWERSQPSERNKAEDLRKIGMRSVEFNGADVVVDSHCAAGELFLLNTEYWEFWAMKGNDFRVRGPFDTHNQDAWVGQIILYGNVVCTSPRLQSRISNIT